MINNDGISLSNAHLLDEVVYSNDGGKGKISGEAVAAGATLAAGLVSAIASRPRNESKQEMKAACGRKPFIAGRRKKDIYQKCVSSYLQSKNEADARAAAEKEYTPPPYTPPKDEKKKFLGMPLGVGITVSVLFVAALGFGAYKLIKR